MTEIRFYHMQRTPADRAIPQIAYKAYQSGKRVLIKCADADQCEKLNTALWVFASDVFLPHGSSADDFADRQPVYLTAGNDNPNGAKILIAAPGCVAGGVTGGAAGFDLCCEMLNGRDDAQIEQARARWKTYRDQGFEVSYWQETEKGWEKKA